MNQIRYVNFRTLLDSNVYGNNVKRSDTTKSVLSGMWSLTLLTKEGFSGLKKLQEENEELEVDTRKAVNKALQENPIVSPKEEEYLEAVRSYVHQEISGKFRR